MKAAVVVFPGTNCEHDTVYALETLGVNADLVWHRQTSLAGYDGVVLPGGFAHGDYLRTGAIARFSPIMDEVRRFADLGRPVLGICNGFQVLCEAGILPGALVANRDLRFLCRRVHLRVEQTASVLTTETAFGDILAVPLNSYEGNYIAPADDLASLERGGQVILRYCDEAGSVGDGTNPNGSMNAIAGICNEEGNVAGLMPHPERAVEPVLGAIGGLPLLRSFARALAPAAV